MFCYVVNRNAANSRKSSNLPVKQADTCCVLFGNTSSLLTIGALYSAALASTRQSLSAESPGYDVRTSSLFFRSFPLCAAKVCILPLLFSSSFTPSFSPCFYSIRIAFFSIIFSVQFYGHVFDHHQMKAENRSKWLLAYKSILYESILYKSS